MGDKSVPVELLECLEVLLITYADFGMNHKHDDGTETPNAKLCRQSAAKIKAILAAPATSKLSAEQPVAWAVYCNGRPVEGNERDTLGSAEHLLNWLTEHHPGDKRKIVPLYAHPSALDEGWIPVSERLPAKPGEQFVHCTTGYTTILYYVDGEWLESDKQTVDSRKRENDYWGRFITHWQPLPEPPLRG